MKCALWDYEGWLLFIFSTFVHQIEFVHQIDTLICLKGVEQVIS